MMKTDIQVFLKFPERWWGVWGRAMVTYKWEQTPLPAPLNAECIGTHSVPKFHNVISNAAISYSSSSITDIQSQQIKNWGLVKLL
jgi:hypothetical protein